jgi:hypothetical protein
MGKNALVVVIDLSAEIAEFDLVFNLAGDRACMAANAALKVYRHAPLRRFPVHTTTSEMVLSLMNVRDLIPADGARGDWLGPQRNAGRATAQNGDILTYATR